MSALDAYTSTFDPKAAASSLARMSVVRPSKLQGPATFRILPAPTTWPAGNKPVPGAANVTRTGPFVAYHKHVFGEPGNYVSFACPERNGAGVACPVCAEASRLRGSQDKVLSARGWDLSASHVVLVNAVDRSTGQVVTLELTAPSGKPSGKTQYEKLLAAAAHPTNGGEIVNPREGYDIVITKTGSGQTGTSYDVQLVRKPSALAATDEAMLKLIDSQPDIPAILAADIEAGRAKVAELSAPGGARPAAALGHTATAADDLYGDTELVDDADY
jgi:hypothetical protein